MRSTAAVVSARTVMRRPARSPHGLAAAALDVASLQPVIAPLRWAPTVGAVTTFDHDGESPDPRATPPSDPWLETAPTSPIDLGAPAPTRVYDEPPRRSRHLGWWAATAVLAVLACAAGAALYPFDDDSPDNAGPQVTPSATTTADNRTQSAAPAKTVTSQAAAPPPGQLVIYEVTSNGPRDVGSVQFTDADGDIIRLGGIRLPWRKTFRVTADRHPLVLIAQRKKGAAGQVTCSITFDDKLLSKTTRTGRFAAPECSG